MSNLLDYLLQNEPSFRKARLPALYSDFRSQRTLNPDGYEANISAWRKALVTIARSGLAPSAKSDGAPNLFVLDCDEQLLRALESKQYGRPLALGTVLAECLQARDIIPLQDFLDAKNIHSQPSWTITKAPRALAGWALRQLGVADMLSGWFDQVPTGQFVVLSNLEAALRDMAEATSDCVTRFERTFSKAHFAKTFGHKLVAGGRTLSATDVDVFLVYLSRHRGLAAYDGQTVRLKPRPGEPRSITAEDTSIAQLRELASYLAHQTAVLTARVDELAAAAKQAVARKNRVAALAALRAKKLAESTLAARFASLAQLEETADRIQRAADNVELVRVMEGSGEALRRLNAAVGGAEGVEAVVERLRGQMDAADEVNSILADAETAGGVVVDEGEIDDELAAIEGEERAKEEAERKKAEEERKREEERRAAAEAEEVRKRLEAAGSVPAVAQEEGGGEREVEAKTAAVAEEVGRMTLEEVSEPEPQPAI